MLPQLFTASSMLFLHPFNVDILNISFFLIYSSFRFDKNWLNQLNYKKKSFRLQTLNALSLLSLKLYSRNVLHSHYCHYWPSRHRYLSTIFVIEIVLFSLWDPGMFSTLYSLLSTKINVNVIDDDDDHSFWIPTPSCLFLFTTL